jgi:hypothetical protein
VLGFHSEVLDVEEAEELRVPRIGDVVELGPTVPSVALLPQSWRPIPRMSRSPIFITCMSSADVSA